MGSSRKPAPAEPESGALQALDLKPFLKQYLRPGCRLSVAYSGGLDSSVLLHLLAHHRADLDLDLELEAVHVHHGLSPHADRWEAHCADTCVALDVPLRIRRVQVRPSGQGLEAAARQARYDAFASMGVTHLALAHHLDDQVETFFLRLLRGAGPRGLAGMEAVGRRQGMCLLRPLLHLRRSQIETHARLLGVHHVEDESNQEPALDRNYIRHQVLPILADRYPAYRTVVSREMALQGEVSDMLDGLAEQDLAQAAAGLSLDLRALANLSGARVRNALRHWLRQHLGSVPGVDSLHALWIQISSTRPGSELVWRHDGWTVRRYRQTLWLEQANQPQPVGRVRLPWQGEGALPWPLGGELAVAPTVGDGISQARLAEGTWAFMPREGGELFRLADNRPLRSLKKCLQEAAIPPWRRARMPLLYHDGHPVWVPGLGVDARYQAGRDESGWLISWQ